MKVLNYFSLIFLSNDLIFQKLLKILIKKKKYNYYPRLESPIEIYINTNISNYNRNSFVTNNDSNYAEINSISIIESKVKNKNICIAWIDLSLNVGNKLLAKPNFILKEINGCFEFNTINALMGSSGAGKTSLLHCLNGRYNSNLSLETKIHLTSEEKFRSCFISQDLKEHIVIGLTVKQCLLYASRLKNSNNNLDINHKENVEKIMNEFSMNDISNNSVEYCSGGQQRIITIACEMTSLIKPNLLLIDEPTTGLDSESSEIVCLIKKI